MTLTYRKLEVADAETCVALRKEMLTNAPGSFGSSPEEDRGSDLALVRERLTGSADQAVFGAFDKTAGLVGSVGVHCATRLKERHKASVWGMYVAPAFRRQGAGQALMQSVIAFAQSAPRIEQIQLSVSASAPGAHRLYESLGFVVWGTEPDALRVTGQSFDEHHMMLVL